MPAPLIRFNLDETRQMSRALRASSDQECADTVAVLVDQLQTRLGRRCAADLIAHWPRNWVVARQRLNTLADHLQGFGDQMLWSASALDFGLPNWNIGARLQPDLARLIADWFKEQLFFGLENVEHFEETELQMRGLASPANVTSYDRNKRQRLPTIGYGVHVSFRAGDVRAGGAGNDPHLLGPMMGTFTHGLTWAPPIASHPNRSSIRQTISVLRKRRGSALPALPGWHQDWDLETYMGFGMYVSNFSDE